MSLQAMSSRSDSGNDTRGSSESDNSPTPTPTRHHQRPFPHHKLQPVKFSTRPATSQEHQQCKIQSTLPSQSAVSLKQSANYNGGIASQQLLAHQSRYSALSSSNALNANLPHSNASQTVVSKVNSSRGPINTKTSPVSRTTPIITPQTIQRNVPGGHHNVNGRIALHSSLQSRITANNSSQPHVANRTFTSNPSTITSRASLGNNFIPGNSRGQSNSTVSSTRTTPTNHSSTRITPTTVPLPARNTPTNPPPPHSNRTTPTNPPLSHSNRTTPTNVSLPYCNNRTTPTNHSLSSHSNRTTPTNVPLPQCNRITPNNVPLPHCSRTTPTSGGGGALTARVTPTRITPSTPVLRYTGNAHHRHNQVSQRLTPSSVGSVVCSTSGRGGQPLRPAPRR